MTTTTTEEFSFPITASPGGGAFIDSPPLWRRRVGTTSTSSSSTSSEEEEREAHALQRKSYSSIEGGRIDPHLMEIDGGHDRMDLLWEFFNEDLPPRKRHSSMAEFADERDQFPPALSLAKAGGGRAVMSARNKKLRLVVLARVLRRMFLLHHQPVKKRSW